MRAAIRTGLFGYTLSYKTTYPEPSFSPLKDPRSVLVRVTAAAINPVDYKLPRALIGAVYGLDFCGTVTKVGCGVADYAVGDRVYGRSLAGSLAELTVASADSIAKAPEVGNWADSECAALPTAYLTSLQGLRAGGIVPPKGNDDQAKGCVLIIGASGGCGLAAVQLARAMKVPRIIAVCSGRNADLVKEAGATEVVDYTDTNSLEAFWRDNANAGKIDCVYDAATGSGGGEDYTAKSMDILRPDAGQYVSLNGPAEVWLRKAVGKEKKRQTLVLTQNSRDDLETIVSLLDSIRVRPVVDLKPFTVDGVKDGFATLKSRRARGKIVFDVGQWNK